MTRPQLSVAVQKAVRSAQLPTAAQIRQWVRAAADGAVGEVTVRIVGRDESATLNRLYRSRRGPTNVLAFPALEALNPAWPPDEPPPLGDIVICAPVVELEADEQSKPRNAHWAHIVIHGTLHLLGYDHVRAADARTMEARERDVLAGFGVDDPYSLERQ